MAVMLPTWIGSLFLLLCSADGSHHRQPYTYPQLVSDSKGHDMKLNPTFRLREI